MVIIGQVLAAVVDSVILSAIRKVRTRTLVLNFIVFPLIEYVLSYDQTI